jgi:hypothetical protein
MVVAVAIATIVGAVLLLKKARIVKVERNTGYISGK